MRRVFVVLAFALTAAACTSEGLPNSYADQDGRAETQFVEACQSALADSDVDDPVEYCQCAFYTVAADLSFEEFLALDERLRDDPAALSLEERTLLEGVNLPCEFTAADINAAVSSS